VFLEPGADDLGGAGDLSSAPASASAL
jgi:hypothetical protein